MGSGGADVLHAAVHSALGWKYEGADEMLPLGTSYIAST